MKISNNLVFLFLGFIFANSLMALENLIMARTYGITTYGTISYILSSIMLFVTLFDFGSSTALTKIMSGRSGENLTGLSAIITASAITVFCLGLLGATSFLVWYKLFIPPGLAIKNLVSFGPAFLIILFMYCQRFFGAFFDGLKKMVISGVIFIITGTFRFIAITSCAAVSCSIESLVNFICLAYLASTILIISLFWIFLQRNHVVMRFESKEISRFLKISLPFYLPYIGPIILLPILIMIIGQFLTKQDIALFSVAYSLATLSFLVIFPISRTFFPYLNRSFSQNETKEVKIMTDSIIQLTAAVGVIMFLTVCLLGKYVLWLYGTGFSEAHFLLVLLSLGIFFELFRFPANIILHSSSLYFITSRCEVIKYIVIFLSAVCLIPVFGINGVAVSVTTGYFVATSVKVYYIRKNFYFPGPVYLLKLISIILLTSLLFFLKAPEYYYGLVFLFIFIFKIISLKEIKETAGKLLMIQ